MTSDARLIRNILIKDFRKFRNISATLKSQIDDPIYINVIENTNAELWQRLRGIIGKLFTDQKLRQLIRKVDNNLVNLVDYLDNQLTGQSSSSASIVVDIKQMFINQSIDLMASVMFSMDKQNTFLDPLNRLTRLMKRLFFPSKWLILAQLVLPKFMLRVLNITDLVSAEALDEFTRLTNRELAKRLNNNMSSTSEPYDDYFQWLINRCPEIMSDGKTDETTEILKNDQTLSKNEVIANIFSLITGAFDANYLTLTYMAYELAVNPECQQKLYDEIITCFRRLDNKSQKLGDQFDWDEVVKLDYLDACISETLRLHYIINRDGRVANEDYTDLTTGVTIKKDKVIHYSRPAVQRCPDYYPMPDKFIPDRFLKDNRHKLIDSAFLPFGLGRRMCPGYKFGLMAIKLTMAHLVMRYKFVKLDNNQTVFKTNPIVEHLIHSPENLLLKIEKR